MRLFRRRRYQSDEAEIASDHVETAARAVSFDSQNGILIIVAVILAHVSFPVVVFVPHALGDLLLPKSRA